ncbi:unnamed protein product [Paramecium pentaurelia]|uniref:Uncharacterized protein n=1 Tax=Paramecium pentaurelia TaxID=43138 RepID=A0A8S1U7F9_9CILI|nr:unnamed protein product [Paramecium pentaurelia]
MIKSQQEDNCKIQIETERKDQKICGIVNFTFKFQADYQLEYKFEDCLIKNHYLKIDDFEDLVFPEDLNINYCYSNEQGEQIQLDKQDYEIDDISDHDNSYEYNNEGISSFYVQYMVISPNHQFIFLSVIIKILNQQESYRLMVIDIKNQKIKKFCYRNYLPGQRPQFSKNGNVAIMNISKNDKGSRYIFFDLQNDLQKVTIFKFRRQQLLRIEYDDISQCFFYITSSGKLIKQPINFEDYTIDKSKCWKFNICLILNEQLYRYVRFYLLYDSIGLLLDENGIFIVIRIGKNCKVIRNYICKSNPVYIFNKAFVVASDYYQNKLLVIDALKGKLIRKIDFSQRTDKYQYYYPPKRSYYVSYLQYYPQEENSDFEDSSMPQLEKGSKWMIFDVIRGIEKEVNKTILTQENIEKQIFTHNFVAQKYQNKISFQLKL